MTKPSTEQKLKDLTFEKAKEVGQTLEKLMHEDIDLNSVQNMNKALDEGIKINLEIQSLRQLIGKINTDKLPDVPIPENSDYKYAYYLWLLAHATHNENLHKFADRLKQEVLRHENEK